MTIQDAKTVSGEIEKEAQKKTKLNYLQQINIYNTLQYFVLWMVACEQALCLGKKIAFPSP